MFVELKFIDRNFHSSKYDISDSNKCENGNSNSVYLLSGIILSTSIITAVTSAIFAAFVMRLFFEVKCRKRINKSNSPTHSHARSLQNVVGPLYEEVELPNKDITFSQNVAYQSTSRKPQQQISIR